MPGLRWQSLRRDRSARSPRNPAPIPAGPVAGGARTAVALLRLAPTPRRRARRRRIRRRMSSLNVIRLPLRVRQRREGTYVSPAASRLAGAGGVYGESAAGAPARPIPLIVPVRAAPAPHFRDRHFVLRPRPHHGISVARAASPPAAPAQAASTRSRRKTPARPASNEWPAPAAGRSDARRRSHPR